MTALIDVLRIIDAELEGDAFKIVAVNETDTGWRIVVDTDHGADCYYAAQALQLAGVDVGERAEDYEKVSAAVDSGQLLDTLRAQLAEHGPLLVMDIADPPLEAFAVWTDRHQIIIRTVQPEGT